MKNQEKHLETLSEIRSMMEKSSRFISLSGLSGVFAGIIALLGVLAAYLHIGLDPFSGSISWQLVSTNNLNSNTILFLFSNASFVLLSAIGFGIYFTTRNANRKGLKIWDRTTKLLLINLLIPLLAGGIFCFVLFFYKIIILIAPSTLLFYGLALLNASKYTFSHIRYLAIAEIILGLTACFLIGYGLLFWTIGFGLLHIIYGILMYLKYERHTK